MGSCFAQEMGQRLAKSKFNITINPFGILYNPLIIKQLLENILKGAHFDEAAIATRDEYNFHYQAHSRFYAATKSELLNNLGQIQAKLTTLLPKVDVLLLTFGTAWGYELKATRQLVANCHKMPNTLFDKVLIEAHQIESEFGELFRALQSVNPSLRVLLTVSPVKHLKDGMVENTLSKSILRYAAHLIAKRHDFVYYYPAFEILQDDLRDYRFYKADLCHPNALATEYIWEHFTRNFFDATTNNLYKQWVGLYQQIQHRPLIPDHPSYKLQLWQLKEQLENMADHLEVSQELDHIKQLLGD